MEWHEELKKNIKTVEQLKKYIDLTDHEERQLRRVVENHPMSIPRYYMDLIDRMDPNDPLRKMIVPSVEELNLSGSWDPSGEMQVTIMPGLQHKYEPTALILATNRCTGYCRYCFRKRLVGLSTEEIIEQFEKAVKYISGHKEITNVLISGGDPFVLSTKVLENFLHKLSKIKHLYFVRFGTKAPVIFPHRILEDEELTLLLKRYSTPERRIYISTQFNHPHELTEKSARAVNKLMRLGIIVNNQTVLLKDVNDDPILLAELQNRLVGIGVIPYYIFQCRPVKRVKQSFQVPLYKGYMIINEMMKKLNGYSKRSRYIMSHRTGKIEVVGIIGNEFYFKYHEAKDPAMLNKLFTRRINYTAGWLDEL